jgi:phosphoadenosine phosphosulfate reductase
MPEIPPNPQETSSALNAKSSVSSPAAETPSSKDQRLGRQAQIPVQPGFEEISPAIAPLGKARQTLDSETLPAVARLNDCYGRLDTRDLLQRAIHDIFPGRIAAVSAFGSESALLLALIAEVDPNLPVIFLDTGKHFPETLVYRDNLARHLRLSDLRVVTPDPAVLRREDQEGRIWATDPDGCCRLRKVLPLEGALSDFDAWISGRKRIHGGERRDLAVFNALGSHIQINPLARWTEEEIEKAFAERGLPAHPLVSSGYRSIGCAVCTAASTGASGGRDGRWPGFTKTECGIHWTGGTPARVSTPDQG